MGNCRDILRNQVSFPYFRKKERHVDGDPTGFGKIRNDLLNWNSVCGEEGGLSKTRELGEGPEATTITCTVSMGTQKYGTSFQ